MRRLAVILIACCALAVSAGNAAATNVVTGEHGLATIGGGYVFYVGGAQKRFAGDFAYTDVLRFDIASGSTQTIYKFPGNWSPNRLLQYRGGRLFVDMTNDPSGDEDGPTRLVSMDAEGLNQILLTETPVLPAPGVDCFPYLNVAGISDLGEAVVNRFSATEFPGSNCAAIKASMTLSAIAADGTSSQLLSATSPWMAGTRDDVGLGFIFEQGVWGASRNWLLQYNADTSGLIARDRNTGATYPLAVEGAPDRFEAWPDGSAFMYLANDCQKQCGGLVIPSITKRRAVSIDRKNMATDFRACGDQILEFYRPVNPKAKSKAGRLALRGHDGKVVRKLAQKVATYSELADCDGSTALLRRVPYGYSPGMYLRSSKKRAQPELLYTVPLG